MLEIEALTKISVEVNPTDKEKVKITSKTEAKKTEKEPRNLTRKKERHVQWKKCKYEDEGKCKLGNKCPDSHPKKTCQVLGKLDLSPNKDKCQLRHPKNVYFSWEQKGNCLRFF